MFPSTHCRSFRRGVFPVSHLHWYWQPNQMNQRQNTNTKQHNTTQKWP